jgi:DNA-binding NarL/FixJ family response regulator
MGSDAKKWYNDNVKVRTLLSDDHDVVRAGIRNGLKEVQDLEIVGEVEDGPTLFAALKELQPDLLLIDVAMPDFKPLAAIRQIKADYPDMKILVISAYDDDVYVQGLLGAGVDGYHLKNQPLSDLRLAVQRVLDGGRWVSSPLIKKLVNYGDGTGTLSLTSRQRDILRLLQQGLDNQTIAQQLCLSVKTVESHLTRLYRLMGVQSRLEAVSYAMQHPEILALSEQEAAPASAPLESPAQGHITMLLVDDNVRYRRRLRWMIGKVWPQGKIHEAQDTKEAVQLTERIGPQLVFIDVVLGEEDGLGCTRRIKALSPSSRIVLISAFPDREFHRLGLEAGAVAFLDKKDLDASTLRQIIEDTATYARS